MTNPSYWMLADTEVPLAWDRNRLDAFSAYFKHALLFNQRLMLSDAQAVNCMNFRRLLGSDPDFRLVLDSSLLSIAVRATDDAIEGQPLTKVRDAFAREGKQRSDVAEEFFQDDDLQSRSKLCDIRPYHYAQLRDHYTSNVFEIFRRESAAKVFGDKTQSLLLALMEEESVRNNGLGRIFLYEGLGKVLRARGQEGIWEQFRQQIVQFSDAPYVTGIPSVMEANPIYSPVHQTSFELAYDAKASEAQPVAGVKELAMYSGLDLSSYEYALRKLSVEDVLRLRSSSEFRRFQKLSAGVVKREGHLKDVMEALQDYQIAIDRYILDKHLGRKASITTGTSRLIKPVMKVGHESGVFSLGLVLSDVLGGGLLSLANFFACELLDRKGKRDEARLGLEKRDFHTEIMTSGQNDQISARVMARSNLETLYTSAS